MVMHCFSDCKRSDQGLSKHSSNPLLAFEFGLTTQGYTVEWVQAHCCSNELKETTNAEPNSKPMLVGVR